MKTHWAIAAVALLAAGASRAEVADGVARKLVSDATGALLQADGKRALAILGQLPSDGLDAKSAAFRTCVLGRLRGDGPDPAVTIPGPTTREVLQAYQAYWRAAALDLAAREPEEAKLLGRLKRLVGRSDLKDLDEAEPVVAARLKAEGYHSQAGVTGRLRDMMIWGKETEEVYAVSLPEGAQETRVVFLDAFRSRGWSAYLDCERAATGGWATEEALYVVAPAYDSFEDETFRINFLAHESQHFADKHAFKGMASWELEYRAKLAELALAEATRAKILDRLMSSQGDDPADPHSYANRRVLKALTRRLGVGGEAELADAGGDQLRAAAVSELRADTERRRKAGD